MTQQILFNSEDQSRYSFDNFYPGENQHVLAALKIAYLHVMIFAAYIYMVMQAVVKHICYAHVSNRFSTAVTWI